MSKATDNAWLWVNPSLSSEATTASANASILGAIEVDFGSQLTALEVSQSSNQNSLDAAYDAFRVANGSTSAAAWTNLSPAGATLPVVLTSFNASTEGLNTKLVWNTADEVNIDNYVVERSADGRTYTTIGIVKAANQRTYSSCNASNGPRYKAARLNQTAFLEMLWNLDCNFIRPIYIEINFHRENVTFLICNIYPRVHLNANASSG